MQTLHTMLTRIHQCLDLDTERAKAAEHNRADARSLAKRFPLVHRTVRVGGPRLSEVLAAGRLIAGNPCTHREAHCGIQRALYFFLGCGAFPEGAVAFLADSAVLDRTPATFTPFDTGALERHACPHDGAVPWGDAEKDAFLARHLGFGRHALDFSAEYLASHFHSPVDYVRRQQHSEPDFPTYHGLKSTSGDRRAWSIEVQLGGDLALDAPHMRAIVLGQPDLLADIPDDLVGRVVIADAEGSITPTIHRLITSEAIV